MNAEIVYCYPTTAGPQWHDYAARFIQSYGAFPPLAHHTTTIVLNGGRNSGDIADLFHCLPGVKIIERDNSGYDIGAFQAASQDSKADMAVFFGASTFFRRPGWLNRMIVAFTGRGTALYGAMGNRGNQAVRVWPHVRTTAFWLPPKLFNFYPNKVTRPEHRYQFEHGQDGLTQWVYHRGLKVWVVGFEGLYEWADWDAMPNGFHRGDQSNLLAYDRLCEPPFYA